MDYLNYSIEELKSKGGLFTAKEICSQPGLWKETYSNLIAEKDKIVGFIEKALSNVNLNIILTGAGSSAFIGEALQGYYQKRLYRSARAVGTTEIVTHPENYFLENTPTLLISFARSGNSPESVAAIELARNYCSNLFILNITCNKEGALAKMPNNKNNYTFLLPEETNDKSLAMTSSFSSMLLSGLMIADIFELEKISPVIDTVVDCGNHIINEYTPTLKKIAEIDFNRMVFLGSGSLLGIAHESHLKVQELSDGQLICKFDSFLGFRHGPKAVVNNSTLVCYLLGKNPYARKYEEDLVQSVKNTGAGETTLVIGSKLNNINSDFSVEIPNAIVDIPEDYLSVFFILPAQIIGFFKSLELGLSPDSPSKNNSISRVVQGVTIYDKNNFT